MKREYTDQFDQVIWKYLDKFPGYSFQKLAALITSKEKIPYMPSSFRLLISDAVKRRKQAESQPIPVGAFPDLECFAKDHPAYEIEKSLNSIVVLSDIHLPYHSNLALKTAIKYAKDRDVNCIILNGDTIDAYALSHFERDPYYRNFTKELEITRLFLKELRTYFGRKIKIVWKDGNHENRYDRFMGEKVPEMVGNPDLELENLLKLHEFNVDYVDNITRIKLSKLNILHGNELGIRGAVNIARTVLLKTFANTLVGHWHRQDAHTASKVDGSQISAWASGCLCNLTPDFMPFNQWVHGFTMIQQLPDGNFELEQKRIIAGKVY